MKYLFVCTGNTCRSPMAEGIFNKLAAERSSEDSAQSAGLFAHIGAVASENAVEAMREIGIDISGHRAQALTPEALAGCGKILTMTNSHADVLIAAMPNLADKVSTLSAAAGDSGEISDPFGGDLDEYRVCRDEIKRLIEKMLSNDKV